MAIKSAVTPNSQITSALRQLWLRSRERSAAVKRDANTCQCCNAKGSVAKGREVETEVHHLQAGDINWTRIIRVIRAELLCDPAGLMTLCKPCHIKAHKEGEI
jgi:5-methylcytosine-specific restriction endonuclease McrA